MGAEPAKLKKNSKTSTIHPRSCCKTHSVLGARNAVCAEGPANMAEMPNEQGTALKLKNRESENVIQITGS